MLYTLIFGMPVYMGEEKLGTLKRIIVDNDVASEVTVDPGLLDFERVVPLMDIREATEDRIHLDITEDTWKAYTALDSAGGLNPASSDTPYTRAPQTVHAQPEQPTVKDTRPDKTVTQSAVILSENTAVVDPGRGVEDTLRGLVVDNGRPVELVLAGGDALLFNHVRELGSDRIRVEGASR